jgi:hypothetical protein
MSDVFIVEIELDESPIPDATIRRLDEVQVKRYGQIWRIYKNDEDPFPSNPHAHNVESRLKLDLSNGKLFYKRKYTGNKLAEKDLLFIRDKLKNMPLPTLRLNN